MKSSLASCLPSRFTIQLALATRDFHGSISNLLDFQSTTASISLIADLVNKVSKLSGMLLGIRAHLGEQAESDLVIDRGLDKRFQLRGFEAHLYLGQVDSVRIVLAELMVLWRWSEFIGPEGLLDEGRLARDFGRLPSPTCNQSHIDRLYTALDTLDPPGADLANFGKERISNIPPPVRRGPGSWEVEGFSPYRPGQEVGRPEEVPDWVRLYNGTPDASRLDITGWKTWVLDAPYGCFSPEPGATDSRPKVRRFDEEAGWVGRNDICEFRIVMRSGDGLYFLLGRPSFDWYLDKLTSLDGKSLLLYSDRFHGFFHGKIDIGDPAKRFLFQLRPDEVFEALVNSGHSEDLPMDTKPSLSEIGKASSSPPISSESEPLIQADDAVPPIRDEAIEERALSAKEPEKPIKPLTRCEMWCIDTIKKQGVRVSKSGMQRLGQAKDATKEDELHGASTIGNSLAKLHRLGILNNKQDGGSRGKGYGLPEWDQC